MACEHCTGREVYDHGFDLPDTRVVLHVPAPCDCCDGDGRVFCTLDGNTQRTSLRWDPVAREHVYLEWGTYDVRALTPEERETYSQPGFWENGTVAGNHGVHRLTDTTFLEECGECDGSGTSTYGPRITIRVDRQWFTCDCGYGTDYRCTYRVDLDGVDQGVWFSSEAKAYRWVTIEWPDAVEDEVEEDGERWLRRAEGWSY